ncbi:UDP-glucuronate 4-epimerase 1 [Physcomitrium patens]|uniref:UDP-glucuronate 4-epimerase n=2 Tax=Physcomitrium patens TaxID=3218 RepID=A0A7I4C034_PHYPA|nr:UDP-glucuronate 4-epimerase 1-like [Physcomitrium patens]|eukprot:XP_024368439.1 UDP-glucuronate 4-epimerase 1-like [Physcomitrella patens]
MLWSITEHHRARGVFELWKSLPETARRAFAAEFSSGGASNAEPCGPSDYSRQCELRSGHLEAVGVRSEAVAPTLCKSRGGSLEVRYEVNCWVLSHKGRFPAYAFCEKRGGGISMYDSLNGSLQNPLLMRMPPSVLDEFPSTPGKVKMERSNYFGRVGSRWHSSVSAKLLCLTSILLLLTISAFFWVSSAGIDSQRPPTFQRSHEWEKRVRQSCLPRREDNPLVVLVTGAAGFVGSHVSLALRKRGDGVVGLDNFNSYYEVSLKRARQELLAKHSVFVIDGDINDKFIIESILEAVPITHVMHLAAQAGVRYAMQNPQSYIHSNIAGLVNIFEVCKAANPQPAIVWASSSSVYGLNTKVPFSEADRTDQPASLYAATKKAGEGIAHTYNHIYGLSITGLRFFTVYGPWGRPDMAYFSFTRDILKGNPISVYSGAGGKDLARDFTFIDDIVKGCVASLDTAEKSTGSGGKKTGPAMLRVFNLGNTSPVTVPTLVDILEKHLNTKAKRQIIKMPRNGDVPFTHANISSAQAQLGYRPTTNLDTGLKKFVKWYLSYYGDNTNRRLWVGNHEKII